MATGSPGPGPARGAFHLARSWALTGLFVAGFAGLFVGSLQPGWTDLTGAVWGSLQAPLGWGGWLLAGLLLLRRAAHYGDS